MLEIYFTNTYINKYLWIYILTKSISKVLKMFEMTKKYFLLKDLHAFLFLNKGNKILCKEIFFSLFKKDMINF